MSQLKVDNITDEEGTGAPNFSNGVALSGTPLSGVASEAEAEAGTDNAHVMTPLRVRNSLQAVGGAPIYAARAWVSFNGTGTVAIRASGNVSSVTDLGVGHYRINFAAAMPSTTYAVVLGGNTGSFANNAFNLFTGGGVASSNVVVRNCSSGGNALDASRLSVAIFN